MIDLDTLKNQMWAAEEAGSSTAKISTADLRWMIIIYERAIMQYNASLLYSEAIEEFEAKQLGDEGFEASGNKALEAFEGWQDATDQLEDVVEEALQED